MALAGRPGIGKTTLVQAVRADALAAGYWTSAEIISLGSEGSSEDLLGRLISVAYDAVLASCPKAVGSAVAVKDAQQLVCSSRLQLRGGSASVSLAGLSAGEPLENLPKPERCRCSARDFSKSTGEIRDFLMFPY
ncbi:MAG: hypothetical protein ERJ67_11100 [Aphanocapsa feldmannii 277cV]|uniref:AAA family ATPase n=1 Tax=Aphanocapsa feldmannii 277cV TaxID=2507553 RepID=A0A524RKL2_9CHRO|nr:MAG: hypothetical protein ERJ67_11100 [Aphanocapsa feldmannii 277cV]